MVSTAAVPLSAAGASTTMFRDGGVGGLMVSILGDKGFNKASSSGGHCHVYTGRCRRGRCVIFDGKRKKRACKGGDSKNTKLPHPNFLLPQGPELLGTVIFSENSQICILFIPETCVIFDASSRVQKTEFMLVCASSYVKTPVWLVAYCA